MFHLETAFKEMSRGDQAAFDFLAAFYFWCHSQDDLIDRDKDVPVSQTVAYNLDLMQAIGKNEFFQQHRDFLWPVIVTSSLAYIASEDLRRKPDVLERITAQVLKSEYANVLFAVSFLTGGFPHALAMSRRYREYAFDHEKPAV